MLATATFPISVSESPATGRLSLSDRPVRVRRSAKRAPAAGSVCLIVSSDPLKQLMFGQAAKRCGWKSVVCDNKATADQQIATGSVGTVLVDVSSMEAASANDRRQLVESLASEKKLLTVVCGRSNDSQQEIWARQQAAWMYLAGVAPESDLDPVLNAAKEVADRLNKKRSLATAGNGSDF